MKKIKDLTVRQFFDFCEKHSSCAECPLGDYSNYECDIHCKKAMLEKEVEVDE